MRRSALESGRALEKACTLPNETWPTTRLRQQGYQATMDRHKQQPGRHLYQAITRSGAQEAHTAYLQRSGLTPRDNRSSDTQLKVVYR